RGAFEELAADGPARSLHDGPSATHRRGGRPSAAAGGVSRGGCREPDAWASGSLIYTTTPTTSRRLRLPSPQMGVCVHLSAEEVRQAEAEDGVPPWCVGL